MRYGNHLEIPFSNFIHKNNDTELCNFQIILNLESNKEDAAGSPVFYSA